MSNKFWIAALALSAGACGKGPPAEPPVMQAVASSTIAGREWVLVAIDDKAVSIPKPPTLRLDSAAVRAAGHGGCNHYSASYSLRGDSLTFGPAMATKMFCNEGSAIEQKFFDALAETKSYELSDSSLVLRTSRGQALKFKPSSS